MEDIKQPKFGYEYPRPAVTTDCVIFGFDLRRADLQVLLIERGIEPFKGQWALPGGFVRIESKTNVAGFVEEEKNESLMDCALRELREETGLGINYIQEIGTFSNFGRDPRGVIITDAYFALVNIQNVRGGDDARKAEWFSLKKILADIEDGKHLAFDHDLILKKAFRALKEELYFRPIGFDLLPMEFSMSELQHLYESITDRKFDRRNFARKMLDIGILDQIPSDVPATRRTPTLYRFNKARYDEFKASDRPRMEF